MTANAFEAADLQSRILLALFELCRDTAHVSATTLADAAGTTPTRAAAGLIALERAGLCDASRARLTMFGLVAAARLGAASSSGGGKLGKLQAKTADSTRADRQLPIAALPSQPPDARRRFPADTFTYSHSWGISHAGPRTKLY